MKKKILYVVILTLIIQTSSFSNISTEFENYLVHVDSFSDENGSFTYSLSEGTNPSYQINPYDFHIQVDTSIIENISSPLGWDVQVGADTISWSWTNSSPHEALNSSPIDFSIQCLVSDSLNNSEGITTFGYPGPGGYSKFEYLQPVPEPSTIVLTTLMGASLWLIRRR